MTEEEYLQYWKNLWAETNKENIILEKKLQLAERKIKYLTYDRVKYDPYEELRKLQGEMAKLFATLEDIFLIDLMQYSRKEIKQKAREALGRGKFYGEN